MALDDKQLLELRERLWREMVLDADLPTDPLTVWQPLYADTLAAVLTRGLPQDWVKLTALLRERQPIHPMLLPALAEALEVRGRPKRDGRKRKLSPVEELEAARQVMHLRRAGHSDAESTAEVAQRHGVSESVVKRAVARHVSPLQRLVASRRVRTSGKF